MRNGRHKSTNAPNRWRELRLASGKSLRQVAREAEMDPAHLSRVERGRAQLSLPAAARLTRVLGLTDFSWIFGREGRER